MNPSRKKLLCWACAFGNSKQGRVGRSVSLRTSGIGALAFDNERSLMLKMPPSLQYESLVFFLESQVTLMYQLILLIMM